MREWKRDGYTVEEREFDYDLHCFAVIVEGKREQIITPDSIESMSNVVADLDAGEDVQGWEDGMGNTIYTDPDLLVYDEDTFQAMIEDWQADHAEEMEDLVVDFDGIEFDDDARRWVATAHDAKASYSLTDDGTGNIVIY